MKRAVATVCLSGLLSDKIDAAARAGFDGIELFEPDLTASHLSPAEVREMCASRGLSIEMFQPFRDVEGTTPDQFADVLRRGEATFALMEQLGTDLLLVCSNARSDAIDDDTLAIRQLGAFADAGARHGIRVAYEALAWGTHVGTWEHAWDLVEGADRPNLGICLDSFHVLVHGRHTGLMARLPADKIFFVQLADAPRLEMGLRPWSRHFRLFPGEGNLPVAQMVADIVRSGYDGPLSLEVFNDVYRQSDPWVTATGARRSLEWVHPQGRRAPPPTGWAEVVLSSSEPAELRRVFEALDFAPSASDTWVHGDTVISIKPSSEGEVGPLISVGLVHRGDQSDDDGESGGADREPAGEEQSPLAIARALTRRPASPPAQPSGDESLLLDHITVTEQFERFHEAIGYLRSVVGLEVEHYDEDAGPFGFVRRASLKSDAGPVTIGLVSSLLPRGSWRPGVESPQHIAFAVDDIVAAARSFESHGVPILSVPDNYYADLRKSSGLPLASVEALQRHHIMCDVDDSGRLLHFCTEMMGSLYVEVLERSDGYEGQASGAAVRMAAQVAASRRRSSPAAG